ncbi:MAG: preprotein translocase subunit YajC [Actinomycetes bacterium]
MTTFISIAATQNSGPPWLLYVLMILFGAMYLLFIRPRQQAQRKARSQASAVEIGDVVVTIGGTHGVVVSLDDTYVTLATGQNAGDDPALGAPNRITFVKGAIARKIEPEMAAVSNTEITEDAGEGSDGEDTQG